MNERNGRILAGILGVLAGLLQIYSVMVDRVDGAGFPTGDVAMGVFWMALGVYFFSGAARVSRTDQRE